MNLQTEYLGLKLKSPFIVGASPLCDQTAMARRLQDAGAAAVVMRSLFEEQFAPPPAVTVRPAGLEPAEPLPEQTDYHLSPDQYLRQLENLKAHLSIPVIASLNGHQPGGWIRFTRRLEEAGADAIELNFYQVVADPSVAADRVETEMLETVGLASGTVNIPISVKLSPYHTAVAQLAVALELAGAAGVVLFNRFYQPDVNETDLEVEPQLKLSDPQELLLRLRWLAILSPQLRGSLAATGGIHTSGDAAKAILTGAHAVQVVSVLLRHGPHVLATLCDGLSQWMRRHGFKSLEAGRGLLNAHRYHDATAFERANYLRTLQSWKA